MMNYIYIYGYTSYDFEYMHICTAADYEWKVLAIDLYFIPHTLMTHVKNLIQIEITVCSWCCFHHCNSGECWKFIYFKCENARETRSHFSTVSIHTKLKHFNCLKCYSFKARYSLKYYATHSIISPYNT